MRKQNLHRSGMSSKARDSIQSWSMSQDAALILQKGKHIGAICGLNYNTKCPSAVDPLKPSPKASRERPSMGFKDSISGGSAFPLQLQCQSSECKACLLLLPKSPHLVRLEIRAPFPNFDGKAQLNRGKNSAGAFFLIVCVTV